MDIKGIGVGSTGGNVWVRFAVDDSTRHSTQAPEIRSKFLGKLFVAPRQLSFPWFRIPERLSDISFRVVAGLAAVMNPLRENGFTLATLDCLLIVVLAVASNPDDPAQREKPKSHLFLENQRKTIVLRKLCDGFQFFLPLVPVPLVE